MPKKETKPKMSRNVQKEQTVQKDIDYGTKANAELRQSVVFELTLKGFTIPRIAQALGVSEKTVQRDQDVNQEKSLARLEEIRKKFRNDEHFMRRFQELEMLKQIAYQALAEQKLDRSSLIKEIKQINEDMDGVFRKVGIKVEEGETKPLKLLLGWEDDGDDEDDED